MAGLARTRLRAREPEPRFDREQKKLAGQILEALDRRDSNAALELGDRKERLEFVPLHDRLVRFMAEVWGYVLERFGAEELGRFHLAAAEHSAADSKPGSASRRRSSHAPRPFSRASTWATSRSRSTRTSSGSSSRPAAVAAAAARRRVRRIDGRCLTLRSRAS